MTQKKKKRGGMMTGDQRRKKILEGVPVEMVHKGCTGKSGAQRSREKKERASTSLLAKRCLCQLCSGEKGVEVVREVMPY